MAVQVTHTATSCTHICARLTNLHGHLPATTHEGRGCMHALPCMQVRIVREKLTGKIMAMKKLKKAEMLKRGQVRWQGRSR